MAKPETEIGHGAISPYSWGNFANTAEEVPELLGTERIRVFNKMRHDSMVAGLWLALTMPIRRYKWYIDPNDARDEVVENTAKSISLPILQEEKPKGRSRGRFDFGDHLRQALLSCIYGSEFFEQVYGFENSDKDWKPDRTNPGLYVVRKLAMRMPLTISEIVTERDGGLKGIRQWPDGRGAGVSSMQAPLIPVDKLVAYVHEKEGGDWYGSSVLRACYRDWLIKDEMIRVNAVNNKRNGIGVPMAFAAEGATQAEIEAGKALAMAYRGGDASGGALPHGWDLRFRGVEGTLPDTIGTIRYHDEQITKSVLAQFLNLGTTESGSRALGESFIDFFTMCQEAIANEFMTTFNEHVIEDLVDLNFGPDEPVPLLAYDPAPDASASVVDLVALVNAGLVEPDDAIREYVRDRFKLPEGPVADPDDPDEDPEVPTAPKLIDVAAAGREKQRRPIRVTSKPAVPPPGDDFWKAKGTHVHAAEPDNDAFTEQLEELLAVWLAEVKAAQVDELTTLISGLSPTDVAALVSIRTTASGAVALADAMIAMAETAMDQAIAEAAEQGITIERPDTTELYGRLTERANAIDAVMAQSISTTASQQALLHAGGALAAAEIAGEVRSHLEELTDRYPRDQITGALTHAENTARFTVFAAGPTPERIYASELRDARRCEACKAVNGKEYASLEEAERDYPAGGYVKCAGGARCRGTIIATWTESDGDQSS